jgi:hypothetical protein
MGLPNAVIGNERETFLREFLQKLFPAHRRFSTGVITDSGNRLSGQIDVAIEYGHIPSFPMPQSTDCLLLAESVAMIIEVKSDLGAQWNQVRETVKKVKPIQRALNVQMSLGAAPGPGIPCIAVGYTGHSTLDGLKQRLSTTPNDECPDAALVIESGCFSGLGVDAHGEFGLYALCVVIQRELERLAFATPDLLTYAR